jgi:hypothetical protein
VICARTALVCASLVAGCANLPAIVPACGNGVLEPGEDCDTPDPRCQRCGWTCGPGGDCSAIPAPRDGRGYACGADGFCHAAGGAFAGETSAEPFAAQSVYVADVDRDQIGDAIGINNESIVTRFGDFGGQLVRTRTLQTAVAAGTIAITDLGVDGHRDVVLPTRDGIVAYASPQQVVSPFAFALEAAGYHVVPHAVIPIDGRRLAVIADNVPDDGFVAGAILDIGAIGLGTTSFSLCNERFTSGGFETNSVDFYDTTAAGVPSVSFTFIATNAAGQREACAIAIAENLATNPISYSATIAPVIAAPSTRGVLAILDGSGCPSAVVSDNGPSAMYRYLAQRDTNGTCAFTGATQPLPKLFGASSDVAVGRVRLVPPIAGAAPDALVISSGIFAIAADGSTATSIYAADRLLTAAGAGDVNADGKTDAIAIGTDETIDVLYRTVAPDGFLRSRLAIDGVPSHLTIGDFDGNGAADIAYTERVPSGDALAIAYGTVDRPLPPVEVADFDSVTTMIRVKLADSADPGNLVDGLGTIEQRSSGGQTISVVSGFHGNPDRALIPYFDVRGANARSTFRAVVGGHFVPASTSFDMLAFEIADPPLGGATLWRFAGGDPGSIAITLPGVFASKTGATPAYALLDGTMLPIADCAQQAGDALCLDGGGLVAWPTASTDLAIAIDARTARFLVIDAGAADAAFQVPVATTPLPIAAQAITCAKTPAAPCMPAGATLNTAFVADIDGDGASELVIAFGAPGDAAPNAGVLECTVTANGISCGNLVAEAGLPTACRDAAPARVALVGQTRGMVPAASSDLVVLCDGTIYRLSHGASGYAATMLVTLPADVMVVDRIGVGDVTGDAVDDLLVLATDPAGLVRLHVLPQLTSREVAR